MRRTAAILVALALVVSVYASATPVTASVSTAPYDEPIDKGPSIRSSHTPVNYATLPECFEDPIPYYEIGDVAYWLAYDDYEGYYFFTPFQLTAMSDNCEIWVQLDLGWPAGDAREYPTINDDMIGYVLDQFDTVIYPIDTQYFGVQDYHDGQYSALEAWGYVPPGYYNDSSRNVILIENVRDEQYYDPAYPYFIAGFYSPNLELYMDRNIITIDCKEWEYRLGPEGHEWVSGRYVDRPYQYETVVAHELQHLIHDDYNPLDDAFMNEGCSMYSEILTYNLIDWRDVNSFLYTPDNSLTVWEDQGGINTLADYGQALLFTTYLSDHYGGADFISYFVQAGVPGIEGVDAALEHFGYEDRFNDVFYNWRIANLIHSDFPGCGKYNYKTIDLNSEEAIRTRIYNVSGLPVQWSKGTDFGNTTTILGYDTGVAEVGPYGTDYIKFYNWKKTGFIYFDGDDTATYGWVQTADGYWYSNTGNMMNALLQGQAYVDPANPSLTITTYWDTEPAWDFGFIQVSTDSGQTWISLGNEYTTYDHDPNALPDIIANLPGLTGWSENWVEMSFDLSAYAGQTVLIGFRYMTDLFVAYEGWYISEAGVSGTPLELKPVYPEADFQVSVVYAYQMCGHTYYMPSSMLLDDQTETGFAAAFLKKPSYAILVVSPTMLQGWVDYRFKAQALGYGHKGHQIEWC